jgi:hypothetical protein
MRHVDNFWDTWTSSYKICGYFYNLKSDKNSYTHLQWLLHHRLTNAPTYFVRSPCCYFLHDKNYLVRFKRHPRSYSEWYECRRLYDIHLKHSGRLFSSDMTFILCFIKFNWFEYVAVHVVISLQRGWILWCVRDWPYRPLCVTRFPNKEKIQYNSLTFAK